MYDPFQALTFKLTWMCKSTFRKLFFLFICLHGRISEVCWFFAFGLFLVLYFFFTSNISILSYYIDKEHFSSRFGFWFPVHRDPSKEMLSSIKYAMFAQQFLYCTAVMSLGEVSLLNYYFN